MLTPGPGLRAGGQLGTTLVELYPGESWIIGPDAGQYNIVASRYHTLQYYDPIMQVWQGVGSSYTGGLANTIFSDGKNWRLANQTGCAVGALLYNGGSSYTSAPTVTASSGGSLWRAIVGGAINTSVTVSNAGTNYTYAPTVVFAPPPAGGIPATGYCTLSGSTIGSVTVTNQGAGYVTAPTVTFLNDPREINSPNLSDGYGATAYTTLTGANTITGLLCTDFGGAAGALSSLPTLTFTGGGGSGAGAIVIMNWTITAYAVSTAGAGLAGTDVIITALDNFTASTPAYTNPKTQAGLVNTRQATIFAPTSSTGVTATGAVVYDGGCYTSSPVPIVIPTASVVTTAPVVTFTLGGSAGTSYVAPVG